ncbi:MAG: PRC-barrel domain-containing protein [Geminicoccaceae bacterium]|nr:PRC-barrel domain-containing protein [Geminicoccaceae bacterium]
MRTFFLGTASALALLMGVPAIAFADDTIGPNAGNPAVTSMGRDDLSAARANHLTPGQTPDARTRDFQMHEHPNGDAAVEAVYAPTAPDSMVGQEVTDRAGDRVGEITGIVKGSAQRPDEALVKVGGFLGFGGKTVALAATDLQPAGSGRKGYTVDMTKSQLKDMPAYRG